MFNFIKEFFGMPVFEDAPLLKENTFIQKTQELKRESKLIRDKLSAETIKIIQEKIDYNLDENINPSYFKHILWLSNKRRITGRSRGLFSKGTEEYWRALAEYNALKQIPISLKNQEISIKEQGVYPLEVCIDSKTLLGHESSICKIVPLVALVVLLFNIGLVPLW